MEPELLAQIPGADRLVERFGHWPSFHDAEILRLVLDRAGSGPDHANAPTSELLIHTWRSTKQVDARGYYVREKHTLVRFRLERVHDLELAALTEQNVISSLRITPEEVEGRPAFRVGLSPCYGLAGSLLCGRVVIAEITPCNEHAQPTPG